MVIDEHTVDTVTAIVPRMMGKTPVEQTNDRIKTMTQPYLGNKNTDKFHDRYSKNANCQLGEIEDRRYFWTKDEARRAGYTDCDYCLGS